MSETDGLLADVQVEGDDNQQQADDAISHIKPDGETIASDAVASETTEPERPEWLPEKFNTGEDLAKSYIDLEKKFSQGKHKVPDQYDDTILKNAGVPDDDELANFTKSWAKENGVSQAGFEELVSRFTELAGAEAEAAEISYQEEYEKLGKNADVIIKEASDFAQNLIRKGVLSETDLEEYKVMCGTAEGLRVMRKIRGFLGDKPIPVNIEPVSGLPSKEELMAMVGSPQYQTDPAYRMKIEKLFEQVYGSDEYSAI